MPTSLFEPGAPDVLYIVDLSGYVFRAYHAIAPLNAPSGEPTQAVFGTVNMLERLVRQRRPAMLAVAMDSRKPTFRKEIYAEYKAHRPPPPPDLSQQMARCREIVDAFAIPVFQTDGVEADDLIAAAVAQARARHLKVVVVSADKDLMQLVGDDVLLWDTMRDKVFGPAEVLERFGVPVPQVRDWLALTGDASDNIPGVPSVGPKTAKELLVAWGDLDGIYANLERIERKALRDKLAEHQDAARLSRELVTLKADIPVTFDPAALKYGGRDVLTLRKLYQELGFAKHLAALDTLPEPVPVASGSGGEAAAPPPPKAEAMKRELVTVLTRDALESAARELSGAALLAVAAENTTDSAVRGTLVGIGLSGTPGKAYYVPVGHRYFGAPEQLDLAMVAAALEPLLSNAKLPKAAHDGKTVGVALAEAGFSFAGLAFDSLLAGYLLDPESPHELEDLAANELGVGVVAPRSLVPKAKGRQAEFDEVRVEDAANGLGARAEAVRRLADVLGPKLESEGLVPLMNDIELPLAGELAEMERAGVLVDCDVLHALGRRVEKELQTLELEAHRIAGRVFNVNSPRQLETLLFDDLRLKPIKRTKTSRSTDADTLEALAEQHALPKVILEIRQLAKLKGTYIDALPLLVNPRTGRIHTRWEQAVAATGRLSSTDPNLQNIPIRSELGREIRGAFVAPPGTALVSADYSQIELRVLAHLSKDPVLVESFQSGEDVHTRTAMEIFGVSRDAVDAEHRRRAKAVNFGIVYGQGDSGLAKSLGIPRAEAAQFIAAYFRRYEGVRRFMNEVLESTRAAGSVRTLFGRRRLVPDIRSENRARRLAAERIAMNTPIQGTAADLLKLAMLAFRRPPTPGARMVLTVHDELVFEVPLAEVDDAKTRIRKAMEGVHALSVPLVVEVGSGENWSRAH
ncbi:MAG TPA: DNA polymerase I [Polyangiaceae bacterium]|nr:DNA polymerase I [Polyangiaceae bacterium]